MATHSIILAWRIPWTEEPGRATVQDVAELDTTERLHFSFYMPVTCQGDMRQTWFLPSWISQSSRKYLLISPHALLPASPWTSAFLPGTHGQ